MIEFIGCDAECFNCTNSACLNCGVGNSFLNSSSKCEKCPSNQFATYGGKCLNCYDSPNCTPDCYFLP